MLRYLNKCSKGRGAWILMALTALALELTALWFQHIEAMQPCVMCIYERCALFGILAASIIGMIAPGTPLRFVALAGWFYSAYEGIRLTTRHIFLQRPDSFSATCEFVPDFPTWLPLDKWIPQIFAASGDCSVITWTFLTLSMPQWLLIIFSAYLATAVLVLLAQLFKPKRRDLFSR